MAASILPRLGLRAPQTTAPQSGTKPHSVYKTPKYLTQQFLHNTARFAKIDAAGVAFF